MYSGVACAQETEAGYAPLYKGLGGLSFVGHIQGVYRSSYTHIYICICIYIGACTNPNPSTAKSFDESFKATQIGKGLYEYTVFTGGIQEVRFISHI